MGLDITVYRILPKDTTETEHYNTVDGWDERPKWTKKHETIKKLQEYNWDKYKEKTGIDINNIHLWMMSGTEFSGYYMDTGKDVSIKIKDVPLKTVKKKIMYTKEVGYQRKGLNEQFYTDFRDGKIGYYVWSSKELERYKRDYAEDPENFQHNIIDNFIDGECYVTFDW